MTATTKCLNNKCKLRGNCYLFMAVPSEPQEYFRYRPDSDTKCFYFVEINK